MYFQQKCCSVISGSYYSLFQPHWIPAEVEEPGDIIVTQEEKALFDCINQPIITEPGKLSCTQSVREGSTVVGTMIAVSSSVVAVAAILLGTVLI